MYTWKQLQGILRVNSMPYWCAGSKISGLSDASDLKNIGIKELLFLLMRSGLAYSSLVVSVNTDQPKLIKWLKEQGFRRSIGVNNWQNHGGRKTWLYVRPTTKEEFMEVNKRTYM